MRSYTVILNDKESGMFSFEEGFSVAATDVVDAAIKANDVCTAIQGAIRDAKGEFPHIDPDYVRVDSIADQGILLASGDNTPPPSEWISTYVSDILGRIKTHHEND